MSCWLLKTEPEAYSYDDLERDGATTWDGVANNAALKYMRGIKRGDLLMIYHTGDVRALIGLAEATSDPYPDPNRDEERLLVFDARPLRRLPQPVTLATVKADPAFDGFDLVRLPRLSVLPVAEPFRRRLMELAGESL